MKDGFGWIAEAAVKEEKMRWITRLGAMALVVMIAVGMRIPNREIAIRLSTTTSTENSGLLAALLPPFENEYGIKVNVIAVGTGKALKLGENGDVDIVFVHDREAEDEFIGSGFGVNRRDVMVNDFVIVGPPEDPAGVKGMKDAAEVLQKIQAAQAPFVSRGDDSGTHAKEKALWKAAGIVPQGGWYGEAGQGMGVVLTMTDEKKGYCLTDRGTYLAMKEKLRSQVVCEGDRRLFNPYGVIAVSPARHEHVKYVEAMALIGWLTSPRGQRIIREFTKGGPPLFVPSAYGIPR